jgi:hypothetical protein
MLTRWGWAARSHHTHPKPKPNAAFRCFSLLMLMTLLALLTLLTLLMLMKLLALLTYAADTQRVEIAAVVAMKIDLTCMQAWSNMILAAV